MINSKWWNKNEARLIDWLNIKMILVNLKSICEIIVSYDDNCWQPWIWEGCKGWVIRHLLLSSILYFNVFYKTKSLWYKDVLKNHLGYFNHYPIQKDRETPPFTISKHVLYGDKFYLHFSGITFNISKLIFDVKAYWSFSYRLNYYVKG